MLGLMDYPARAWIASAGVLERGMMADYTDERRPQWNVCRVLHGGDGPETTPWFVILGVYDITAEEAVECYARDHMGGTENERDYGNGDCMHVAVEMEPGRADVYRCYKIYDVRIDYRRQCERTDLKPVPGMRQEIRYEKDA